MKNNCLYRIFSFLMALIMFMIEITSSYSPVFAGEEKSGFDVNCGYSVETEIISSWATGYNLRVRIRNDRSTAIHNWGFVFDTADSIQGYYSAIELSKDKESHLIRNAGYNQDIKPGENIEFGYTAYYEGSMDIPEVFSLTSAEEDVNSTDYKVEIVRLNEWDEGGMAQLIITNTSAVRIEDWKLSFESDIRIESIWGALVGKDENGEYVLVNEDYDQNIEAGSSVTIGFVYRGSLSGIENVSMTQVVIKDKKTDTGNNDVNNGTEDNNNGPADGTESASGNNTADDGGTDTGNTEDENDLEKDSDDDGIPDYYEDAIGTDKYTSDTDGDGLSDHEELTTTGTDPLKYDSVIDGIPDSDADSDNDGISNRDEIAAGMNPLSRDSDNDGIEDSKEAVYGTDPLNDDTDADTIRDGDELVLGFDPLSPVTDGIADNEHRTEQKIAENSEALAFFNSKNSEYKISIDIKAAGFAASELTLGESPYSYSMMNDAIVGMIPHIEYGKEDTIENITVKFRIDELLNNSGSASDNLPDLLHPDKKYSIFFYFDEEGVLLPIETMYDEDTKSLYATTDMAGTFCLVDMKKLLENNLQYTIFDEQAYINVQFILQCSGSDKNSFLQERDMITEVFERLVEEYGEGHIRVSVIRMFSANAGQLLYRNGSEDIWFTDPEELKPLLEAQPYSSNTAFADAGGVFRTVYNGLFEEIRPQFVFLLQNGQFRSMPYEYKQTDICREGVYYAEVLIQGYVYANEQYEEEVEEAIASVDGFQTILGKDSADKIFEHVCDKTTEVQHRTVYSTITANGWESVKLDAPLMPDSATDTDGDGLTDWKEANTSLFGVAEDGTLVLPTIEECMHRVNKPYVEAGIEKFKTYFDKMPIDKVTMLPIKSSPMNIDTDGDKFPDNYLDGMTDCYQFRDPNPLKSDVTITELEGGYISIDYHQPVAAKNNWSKDFNNSVCSSYGGDQEWCGPIYGDDYNGATIYCNNTETGESMKELGCGIFAAADAFLYQSIMNTKETNSEIYLGKEKIDIHDLNHIDYEEYLRYIKLVSDYFEIIDWPVNGVAGVILGKDLQSGMNNIADDLGFSQLYLWGAYPRDTKILKDYIIGDIIGGHPIVFAYDHNLKGLKTYTMNEKMQYIDYSELKSHYTCMTGIIEYSDEVLEYVGHRNMIITTVHGVKNYIDFEEYVSEMTMTTDLMGVLKVK